jgi:UDP-N-acetylglucosamine 2-epimerase (non-hydrolysing)
MQQKKILVVVGTRPNFIKVTQFRRAVAAYPKMEVKFVHTGQHYDGNMADIFFEQFGLVPDFFLSIPAGSPNTQMAEIMLRLEKTVQAYQPDLMAVVGDVNSTLAAAITANKFGIKLAHIESGLRSQDRAMPEEFNRLLTDELADLLFVTEPDGLRNLKAEGKPDASVYYVGNTMIDTMVHFSKQIDASTVLEQLQLKPNQFVLMTIHRPGNVDTKEGLLQLLELVNFVTKKYDLVFPIHPRTVKRMQDFNLENDFRSNARIRFTEPLDYFGFQKLIKTCRFVLTDSGGIQEETTFLQVPCLTLRPNTERPVTILEGTNELLPFELTAIQSAIHSIENGSFKKGKIPQFWDGKASERIFEILARIL